MQSPSPKPKLLFVTGVAPARTGGGSMMRAAMTLEALVDEFETYLLVIDKRAHEGWVKSAAPAALDQCAAVEIYDGPKDADATLRRYAETAPLPLHTILRLKAPGPVPDLSRTFAPVEFTHVHLMKSYVAPFVEAFHRLPTPARPHLSLDIDDFESKVSGRLASLHEANGQLEEARIERAQQVKFAAFEQRLIPRFDRLYVCSETDRLEVVSRYAHPDVRVLPNVVHLPIRPRTGEPDSPFTFFFIGSFGWSPNIDAVNFFSRQVIPLLKATTEQPLRFVIAGRDARPLVTTLDAIPEVTVRGWVDDVADCYREAHAFVVPIRAGGGTRIKILESFSHRVPVVATALGAEGLNVSDRDHLLLANDPETFADRCLELMRNPELRAALADRSYRWVAQHHTPAQLKQILKPTTLAG